MRSIKIVLLSFAILLGYACTNNDDDSATPAPSPSLVGNWKLIEVYSDIPADINNDGTSSNDLHIEEPCVLNSERFLIEDGSLTNEWSFILDASGTTPDISCEDFNSSGTWSHTTDEITFIQSGLEQTHEYTLTDNTLTSFDTLDDFFSVNINLVYERQ